MPDEYGRFLNYSDAGAGVGAGDRCGTRVAARRDRMADGPRTGGRTVSPWPTRPSRPSTTSPGSSELWPDSQK
jgi:hypothetical protein